MEHRRIGWLMGVVGLALGLAACDTQTYPPWVSGRLWMMGDTNNRRLVYLTEEQRSKTVSRSRHSSNLENYARYELVMRDGHTGRLRQQVRIRDSRNAWIGRGPTVLGVLSTGIWLWNEGLELRDPATLAVVQTGATLRERNPELGAFLPTEQSYFKVSAPHEALVFKGLDARFFTVDARTGKIALADTDKLANVTWQKKAEDGFIYVQPPGLFPFQSLYGFQVEAFLTPTGMFYGLFSADERADLSKWPRISERVYGEVARHFYAVNYRLDDRNHLEINPKEVRQVGDGLFLQGGFLKRAPQAVWDVANPSSSLVLCKDALGKNVPWTLVRLGRDGKTIWRVSTGLAELDQIADAGKQIVLHGYATYTEPTRMRPALLVWLDTATGKRWQVAVETPASSE